MYQPAVGSAEAGTVFLGDLNSEGEPYWRAWEPWANERIDPKEVEGNSTVSTTSTSYVTGSTAVATTFVAPPSGKVYVTVTAQCEAVAPTSAYCSFEIRVNNSSGAVFLAASDDRSAAVQEDNWSTPTRRKLVTGLTAGTTYYIRTMIRSSNSANTATFFQRSLLIEPVYTDVSPGRPSDSAIVGASVLTAGGSIIRIPNGDTGTSALRIQLPAGDRADAPDTMAFYVNTGTDASPVWSKTGWYNEYGEFRVQPSASTRTPAKVRRVAGQTADLFHIEDENQNALAGFHADGTLFAPNLTGGAVGSVSADSTVTGAPAAPLIRHNRNYAVASGDQNLLEFKVQGVTTSWLDPFGMYRAISPTATDTPVRVRRHASQTSNLVEVQNAAGTQVHWAVDKDGFTVQGNGTAAPVKMAPVLVLATGAPVPAGTPAGTVILRS